MGAATALALLVACGAEPGEQGAANAEAGADAGVGGTQADGGGLDAQDSGAATDAGADSAPTGNFATRVVTFTPGGCAGFGASAMPGVVLGPPVGNGASVGGLHVVSLGRGGEIVLSVEPVAIVDGPGVDFLVFENAFYVGGNPQSIFAEPGEVSVSEDGVTWKTYPCTATSAPYGSCAGWRPVHASPTNGIASTDPAVAGGDPFDLADVGLARARFVRIRDMGGEACPDGGTAAGTRGFDLDGIAIVRGAR